MRRTAPNAQNDTNFFFAFFDMSLSVTNLIRKKRNKKRKVGLTTHTHTTTGQSSITIDTTREDAGKKQMPTRIISWMGPRGCEISQQSTELLRYSPPPKTERTKAERQRIVDEARSLLEELDRPRPPPAAFGTVSDDEEDDEEKLVSEVESDDDNAATASQFDEKETLNETQVPEEVRDNDNDHEEQKEEEVSSSAAPAALNETNQQPTPEPTPTKQEKNDGEEAAVLHEQDERVAADEKETSTAQQQEEADCPKPIEEGTLSSAEPGAETNEGAQEDPAAAAASKHADLAVSDDDEGADKLK